jgi:hydrogenase maturation protein HypF
MGAIAKKIEIRGLVQGVGFRPFIYRLAHGFHLKGTVENNNLGVTIYIEGLERELGNFIDAIPKLIPEAASISKMLVTDSGLNGFDDFKIIKSKSTSDEVTEVSPDIGVCNACLRDMLDQPHRIDYSFTNCTNCGPRFTIIKGLPYDRHQTTMDDFKMCKTCHTEYTTILDRRFHAQPVACNNCGPHYTLYENGQTVTGVKAILERSCKLLEEGKIMAIKGLGGYHMACNPLDETAVAELRKRKNREGKPFALMFKNIESVKKNLFVSSVEEKLLTNWRKPIVLLKVKNKFAPSLSVGLNTIGVMLPYMPFHYQLFEQLKLPALVLTSGNISDEPILIDNELALKTLGPISDAVITYNREIHNRTDDSVAFVAGEKERLIRRSRSYAPSPVNLKLNTEGIFAAGAELVNCFCIGKGEQAILSQHIGDLQNLETFEFYTESVKRFEQLFRFKPTLAVMDMHPDYLSTRFAQKMGIPITTVQHHHAHIASCMAENFLDEKVIGVSFDGTGYGTDGNIWGSEFLVCDLNSFERAVHFEYIPQPGGDVVTKHPWRMMVAYLHHYFGEDLTDRFPGIFTGIEKEEFEMVLFMLKNQINSPLTSSSGRLFDAVSALLGVCPESSYHAEAPMQLEAVADENEQGTYPYENENIIRFKPMFEKMMDDLKSGISVSIVSAKFHNTIVDVILQSVKKISKKTKLKKVVLSGGTFQNRIILERTERVLKAAGFEAFSQSSVPSNDGGIALGQLAIAAKRRDLGLID